MSPNQDPIGTLPDSRESTLGDEGTVIQSGVPLEGVVAVNAQEPLAGAVAAAAAVVVVAVGAATAVTHRVLSAVILEAAAVMPCVSAQPLSSRSRSSTNSSWEQG